MANGRIWIANGLSTHKKECIFMGVNAFKDKGGVLHMWPTIRNEARERSQKKHVKLILGQAIHDGIWFIDEYPDSLNSYLWFDYAIEKTNNTQSPAFQK
jgi:hypothetical protein